MRTGSSCRRVGGGRAPTEPPPTREVDTGQLPPDLGRVAPKVLTQTLRRMERDGLVTLEIFAEVPPRVDYALTDLGRSLARPIAVIGDWAEVHIGQIEAAQAAYDARGR